MDRRAFVTGCGAVLAAPFVAEARVARIAFSRVALFAAWQQFSYGCR